MQTRELGSFSEILDTRAREKARAVDRDLRLGIEPGPLAGVPVSVKDAIWLAGVRSTNGSLVWRDFVPAESGGSAARLEQAGAVVIGKTNNPEFCFFGYTDGPLLGPARNPVDRELTAGGSSGGAAASVAGGVTPVALGSDGGGSIRGPASFCGV
ncbi:MAG: amidase family protein, partial [Acidimicrobiales bacterium]